MIGQHKRDLTIVPYQSGWKELFEQEANRLRNVLGKKALRIEHIGSTSIPNMAAKPIIDIMVAIDSLTQATELIPIIEALDYIYKPHDTVPERMFFAKENQPEFRTHHLNLTEPGSGFWKNQIAFRNYLRTHDQIAAEYITLKKHIAQEYARTKQLDPEAKSEFVARVLELAAQETTKSK
jgi:GrpB-like predicted nucleotidyltransferase (UPF0157 family)